MTTSLSSASGISARGGESATSASGSSPSSGSSPTYTLQSILKFKPADYQSAVSLPEGESSSSGVSGGGVYYGDTVQSYNSSWVSSTGSASNTPTSASDLPQRMPHGRGISISTDGQTRYGGTWSRGKKHGSGVLSSSSMDYEGEFWEDAPHGKCHIKYKAQSGLWGAIKSLRSQPKEFDGEIHRDHGLHGSGLMVYTSGEVYEGEWFRGKRNGRGIQNTPEGERYEGQFEDDVRHGTGVLALASGAQYLGSFAHGKRHGAGKMLRQNGDVFVGDFSYDEMQGNGVMTYKNGDTYSGEWKFNTRHGRGVFKLADKGAIVSGTFVSGLLQGDGTVEIPGKSVFVGEFSHGERIYGTMWLEKPPRSSSSIHRQRPHSHNNPHNSHSSQHHPSSSSSSSSSASVRNSNNNNNQNANAATNASGSNNNNNNSSSSSSSESILSADSATPGTASAFSAILPSSSTAGVYHGPFRGDGVHGRGLFWYPDGSFYAGHWVNGKRQGPGFMRHADGTEYSGEFFNDERHGKGMLRLPSGQIACGIFDTDSTLAVGYFGEWNPGKQILCGRGTFIEENGAVYEGLVQGNRREMLGTLCIPVELSRAKHSILFNNSSKENNNDEKQKGENSSDEKKNSKKEEEQEEEKEKEKGKKEQQNNNSRAKSPTSPPVDDSNSSSSAGGSGSGGANFNWPNSVIAIYAKFGAARVKALRALELQLENEGSNNNSNIIQNILGDNDDDDINNNTSSSAATKKKKKSSSSSQVEVLGDPSSASSMKQAAKREATFSALQSMHIHIPGVASSASCRVHRHSQLAAPTNKKDSSSPARNKNNRGGGDGGESSGKSGAGKGNNNSNNNNNEVDEDDEDEEDEEILHYQTAEEDDCVVISSNEEQEPSSSSQYQQHHPQTRSTAAAAAGGGGAARNHSSSSSASSSSEVFSTSAIARQLRESTNFSLRLTYRGGFVANACHGEGTLVLEDTSSGSSSSSTSHNNNNNSFQSKRNNNNNNNNNSSSEVLCVYSGMWAGGEPCGSGLVTGALSGKRLFVGDWLRGHPHGDGLLYDPGTDATCPLPQIPVQTQNALQRLFSMLKSEGKSQQEEMARLVRLRRGIHRQPHVASGEWYVGEAHGGVTLFLTPVIREVVVVGSKYNNNKKKNRKNKMKLKKVKKEQEKEEQENENEKKSPTRTEEDENQEKSEKEEKKEEEEEEEEEEELEEEEEEKVTETIRRMIRVPFLHGQPRVAFPHAPEVVDISEKLEDKEKCPLCEGSYGILRIPTRCRTCARIGCSSCCNNRQLPAWVPTVVASSVVSSSNNNNNNKKKSNSSSSGKGGEGEEKNNSNLIRIGHDERLGSSHDRSHHHRHAKRDRRAALAAFRAAAASVSGGGDGKSSSSSSSSPGGPGSDSSSDSDYDRDGNEKEKHNSILGKVCEQCNICIDRHVSFVTLWETTADLKLRGAISGYCDSFGKWNGLCKVSIFPPTDVSTSNNNLDQQNQSSSSSSSTSAPLPFSLLTNSTTTTTITTTAASPEENENENENSNKKKNYRRTIKELPIMQQQQQKQKRKEENDNNNNKELIQFHGFFQDGIRDGFGTLVLHHLHGEGYRGHFENDKRHGEGIYRFRDFSSQISLVSSRPLFIGVSGKWEEGKLTMLRYHGYVNSRDWKAEGLGIGYIYDKNSSSPSSSSENNNNNIANNEKENTDNNNRKKEKENNNSSSSSSLPALYEVYNGSWKRARPHGVGIVTILNPQIAATHEAIFIGNFFNGQRHGPGRSMCPSLGRILNGFWVRGVCQGRCVVEDPTRADFAVMRNGKFDGPVWTVYSSSTPVKVESGVLQRCFEIQQSAVLDSSSSSSSSSNLNNSENSSSSSASSSATAAAASSSSSLGDSQNHEKQEIHTMSVSLNTNFSNNRNNKKNNNNNNQKEYANIVRRVALFQDGRLDDSCVSQSIASDTELDDPSKACYFCGTSFGFFSGIIWSARTYCRCCSRVACANCVPHLRQLPWHLNPISKTKDNAETWFKENVKHTVCNMCEEMITSRVGLGALYFDDGLVYCGQLDASSSIDGFLPHRGGFGLWWRGPNDKHVVGSPFAWRHGDAPLVVDPSSSSSSSSKSKQSGSGEKEQEKEEEEEVVETLECPSYSFEEFESWWKSMLAGLNVPVLVVNKKKKKQKKKNEKKNTKQQYEEQKEEDDDDLNHNLNNNNDHHHHHSDATLSNTETQKELASPISLSSTTASTTSASSHRDSKQAPTHDEQEEHDEEEDEDEYEHQQQQEESENDKKEPFLLSEMDLRLLLALASSPPPESSSSSSSSFSSSSSSSSRKTSATSLLVPQHVLVPALKLPEADKIGFKIHEKQNCVLSSWCEVAKEGKDGEDNNKEQQEGGGNRNRKALDSFFGAHQQQQQQQQQQKEQEKVEEGREEKEENQNNSSSLRIFDPIQLPSLPDTKPNDPTPLTHEEVEHALSTARLHSAEALGVVDHVVSTSTTTISATAAATSSSSSSNQNNNHLNQHHRHVHHPHHHQQNYHLGPLPPLPPPIRTPFSSLWDSWETVSLPPGVVSLFENTAKTKNNSSGAQQQQQQQRQLQDGTQNNNTSSGFFSPFMLPGSEGPLAAANTTMVDSATKFAPPPVAFLDDVMVPSSLANARLLPTSLLAGNSSNNNEEEEEWEENNNNDNSEAAVVTTTVTDELGNNNGIELHIQHARDGIGHPKSLRTFSL